MKDGWTREAQTVLVLENGVIKGLSPDKERQMKHAFNHVSFLIAFQRKQTAPKPELPRMQRKSSASHTS